VVVGLGLVFLAGMWTEYTMLESLDSSTPSSNSSNVVQQKVSRPEIDADQFAATVISETNRHRSEAGLAPLIRVTRLDVSSGAKLDHMLRHDYWAHDAPDGTSPWAFIELSGYSHELMGENLARDFDTAKGVVEGWMNSPAHRDNMLAPGYTEMGVVAQHIDNGAFAGWGTWMVVAHYARPR
jgi:uncharacterized protein YkwD